MSRYFVDTEFNSYQGELISLALVSDDNRALYLVFPRPAKVAPWVAVHVMPYLNDVPADSKVYTIFPSMLQSYLEKFFAGDDRPVVVADWPDDIKFLSEALLTGPGTMIKIPRITFELHRVDAYPSSLEGAVQHNALWDAYALKRKCEELELHET